jgi:hypothetical protein
MKIGIIGRPPWRRRRPYLAAFLQIVAAFDGGAIALALMGFGAAGLVGNWIAGRVVERVPIATTAGVAAALMVTSVALSVAGGRGAPLWPRRPAPKAGGLKKSRAPEI